MWAEPANEETAVVTLAEDRERLRAVLGFSEPESSPFANRGGASPIAPADDPDESQDLHDPFDPDFEDLSEDDYEDDYEDDGAQAPGLSVLELIASMQELMHELSIGMTDVAERLSTLEDRPDPTPFVTSAIQEFAREMARGQSAVTQRLTALEQRPDASHAFTSSVHGLSGEMARWSAGVSDRLTALEQRPDPTERLRASIDHLTASVAGMSERLSILERHQPDPKAGLAELDRKLEKALAADSPRDLAAGIRNAMGSLRDRLDVMSTDLRSLKASMQRLTEALVGGAPPRPR